MDLFGDNNNGAEFSPCGKYRYTLHRIWNEELPLVMCIGLNPSTANADKNDPTIRILRKHLSMLGYGGFYMCNLYAIISSTPQILKYSEIDLLKDNKLHFESTEIKCGNNVIFCWGAFKEVNKKRIDYIVRRYPNALCFGKTADGSPMHPMALMYGGVQKAELTPYTK